MGIWRVIQKVRDPDIVLLYWKERKSMIQDLKVSKL